MHCFLMRIGVTGITVSLLLPAATAQIVRVGPWGGVSIRAPFVAVDVLPGRGGTRVRAPLTRVNTGLYRSGYAPVAGYHDAPPYVAPGVAPPVRYGVPLGQAAPAVAPATYAATVQPPSRSVIAARQADAISVAERLGASATRLRHSLRSRPRDGDIWIDYLQPDQVIAAAARGTPDDSLAELLLSYEGVMGNDRLGSIRAADGFQQTYRLLRQFAEPVEQSPRDAPRSGFRASSTEGQTGDPVLAKPLQRNEQERAGPPAREESIVEELPAPRVP